MTGGTGVAVIGAGMAGRSHAHAYRIAQTVFGTGAPEVRLVAIADLNTEFATHTAQRYGFERATSSWQAIAEADDIDAVSIVVANHLHREIAEGLLAAGKHVLPAGPARDHRSGHDRLHRGGDLVTAPLRIGILGAARIADEGIIGPARTLGHQVAAVAARDRTRAEAFAAMQGIATVHDTYADLIADPGVDLVYNALVNSLHARWNIAALQAGKHVLSEKPLTSNAGQVG
jgi:predicted dehydrogenase